jgi:(4S)-4-hydroxy-5-phosphonooxypentane-2,3-dione isomerase
MYGVVVTINIKPGFKERFMPSMLEDAEGSINNEPGCLRFDVRFRTRKTPTASI